jgi:trk system potassium uptake protein TrkH
MSPYYPVIRVFGVLLACFSLTMLVPLLFSHFVRDGAESAYDETALLSFAVGLGLWWTARHHKEDLKVRDGFLLVVLVWALLPVFAGLPFILQLQLSFTDAYFEAMSGLTTTGATVLSGLDTPAALDQPLARHAGLARRHGPDRAGGGGTAAARHRRPADVQGRDAGADEGLQPDAAHGGNRQGPLGGLRRGHRALHPVLHWAGMSWFDAVMHSFTTMGLGGFSSHDASFGHWDSPLIEGITVVFMLIAGMNFATLFLAVRGRSLRPYLFDPEARYFLGVTLASVFGIALYLHWQGIYPEFLTALRHALFNVVSIATTTGFASVDYNLWPIFAPLWMLFLCSFATSAGSTGGGIKMVRAIILYKQVYRELLRAMHPNAIWPVRVGGEPVPQNILTAVLAFGFAYMCFLVALTLVLTFSGLDILTAFTAVVATVNNTGPGLNQVGPSTTYEVLTDFPDLGLQLRHAARPAGNLHPAGGADARFLAALSRSER